MKGRAIIIKGDDTKYYDEVIFVMKDEKLLADKIINSYRKICRIKIMLESIFYFVMLILAVGIGMKILFM